MSLSYNPYAIVAFGGALTAALVAILLWRRRPETGATPSALAMLGAAVWCLGYTLELSSPDLPGKLFWAKAEYLGIVCVPAAWLAVALVYSGHERVLSRRNLALLAVVPLATLALVWTNEHHGLIWSSFELDTRLPIVMSRPTRNIGFWLHWVYEYGLLLSSAILFVQVFHRSDSLFRPQAAILLAGTVCPWIGNALFISGLSPFPRLDLTPLSFSASGVILMWGLFHYRVLDVVPVARDTIVEHLRDGIVVFDTRNRILYMNPAAQAITGRQAQESIGETAEALFPIFGDLLLPWQDSTAKQAEIVDDTGPDRRYLNLRLYPLVSDRGGDLRGRILVMQDVTKRRQMEDRLRDQERLWRELSAKSKRQAQELSLLMQVSEAISQHLELPLLFRAVVEAVAGNFGYTQVSLYTIRDDVLVVSHQVGYPHLLERIPLTIGITGSVARSGRPVLVENVRDDPTFVGAIEGISSEVCVPLRAHSRTVGVLNVESTHGMAMSEADLQLMLAVSEQVGRAIEQAHLNSEICDREAALKQLNEELEQRVEARTAEMERANRTLRAEIDERQRAQEETLRRTEQLEALRQNSLELTAQLDVQSLLASISLRALKLMRATTGSFYVYRPERDLLERVVFHGPQLVESAPTRRRGEGLIGQVWETGQPLFVNDYGRWLARNTAYDDTPSRAVMGIPVSWGDRFLGVVAVVADAPRTFSSEDVNLLKLFADQAAVAIENARLYDQAQRELAERKATQAALWVSEERYALAARAANDGIWDWDLETEEIYLSPRWKAMLGFQEAEIGNRTDEWFSRVCPDDLVSLKSHITHHIESGSAPLAIEYRIRHKDGTYRWVLCRGLAVRDASGRAHRLAGSQTDITDRKLAEEQLLYDALHEGLTGLPNRALFMDRLGHSLDMGRRREHLFAVLFLDLDRFKIVNDSLGHLNGDALLVAVAKRVGCCLRAGDTLARLGGDEFAILLDAILDTGQAGQVAARIQQELSQPFDLAERSIFAHTSIGIAHSAPSYASPEEMLRDADTAMYRAKALGGACHVAFDPAMHLQAVSTLQLEQELQSALNRHELHLYYQPIVSLSTGQMTGVEALIRWQHPLRGMVPPAEFIPLAEESGLIVDIGEWVLRTACTQMKAWLDDGHTDLFIAVNMSARQFQTLRLPELVRQVLEETGIQGRTLHLEITENTATQNDDLALAIMQELNVMGVQIVIDDFGNNYSALGRLKQFPIAILKIDPSFIRDITSDNRSAAITTAIIKMAQGLNLGVVAEGVETEDQRAFLETQHCDEMQGYLYSRPLPADALTRLLERREA